MQTGNIWLRVLPSKLSLHYHLYSLKAAVSQPRGWKKGRLISRQLTDTTCCHMLRQRLVETQEKKKPCRGLGRLIGLASALPFSRGWRKAAGCRRAQLPAARGPTSLRWEANWVPLPLLQQPSHSQAALFPSVKHTSPYLPQDRSQWAGQSEVSLGQA